MVAVNKDSTALDPEIIRTLAEILVDAYIEEQKKKQPDAKEKHDERKQL